MTPRGRRTKPRIPEERREKLTLRGALDELTEHVRTVVQRLPEMTPLGPLTGHDDQVVSLEILGDAGPLYSCSMDGTARSWTLGGLLPRRIPRKARRADHVAARP